MPTPSWTTAEIPALHGRTALVTGANSGIGYQAALELARHGAYVLLGCRSAQKGAAALSQLLAEAPGASAELLLLDMASLRSIHEAAASFAARSTPLDLLINNAGVMALPKRELTEDGFERQFGTNHLGHFALTGLLLPQLLAAPAARVVTVASLAHRRGRFDPTNLQAERKYDAWGAYGLSKLANILFARELDRRARRAGVPLLSVPVHPGVSQTNIISNGPGMTGPKTVVLKLFAPLLMQPDWAGALPTLYAATSPQIHGGEYIGPDGFLEFKGSPTVVQPRAHALSQPDAEQLWTLSEQLTGVTYGPLDA